MAFIFVYLMWPAIYYMFQEALSINSTHSCLEKVSSEEVTQLALNLRHHYNKLQVTYILVVHSHFYIKMFL